MQRYDLRQLVAPLAVIFGLTTACAPLRATLFVPFDAQDTEVEEATEEVITGQVVAVEEGDRVVILAGHMPLTIRLIGVDAPEKGQRYWKEARGFSTELALGQQVTVRHYDLAPTQEVRGHVFLPDGRCLNKELLQAGLARWVATEVDDRTFGFIEREARLSERGLWEAFDSVAPWKWRQTQDRLRRAPKPSAR